MNKIDLVDAGIRVKAGLVTVRTNDAGGASFEIDSGEEIATLTLDAATWAKIKNGVLYGPLSHSGKEMSAYDTAAD